MKKIIGVMWFVFVMAFCVALILSPVLLIDDFKTVMEFATVDSLLAIALEEFATDKLEKKFFND